MFDLPDENSPSPFLKEFPEENDVYLLQPNGAPTHKINVGRLENSQYWESHYRGIGIVLLICFIYFVMTLLGETQIMEQVWTIFLQFAGQFMPQLPKLW